MRVLFIEDESELNELATGQLERQGHRVLSVRSIEEAQRALEGPEGAHIDCLITDHRLPDGFGVAFCVQCRVRYPEIAVGVVSGCLGREEIELMKDYAVPFWRKPILYSQVANELEADLKKRRLTVPPVAPPAEPAPPPPAQESGLGSRLRRAFGRRSGD